MAHLPSCCTLLSAHFPCWLQICMAPQTPLPAVAPTRHSAQVFESAQTPLWQSSSPAHVIPNADFATHLPRVSSQRMFLALHWLLVWHSTHRLVVRLHISDWHCSMEAQFWPNGLRVWHEPSPVISQNWVLLSQSCVPEHCTHLFLELHLSDMQWLLLVHLSWNAPFRTHLRSVLQKVP